MTVDTTMVRYENPGERSDEALAAIHRFAGLAPCPGNFEAVKYPILVNAMRLSGISSGG